MTTENPEQWLDGRVLERVFRQVKDACGTKPPTFDVEPVSVAPKRVKFFKVYKAPGYPVDPKNDEARALDGYMNAFAPQPFGTFDTTALNCWLVDNVN